MKKNINYLILLLSILFMVGCTNAEGVSTTDVEVETDEQEETIVNTNKSSEADVETDPQEVTSANRNKNNEDKTAAEEAPTETNNDLFLGYELIEVDGGDLSGDREANVVVDIGYGDREYWAFTNENGQLVKVVAEEIVLQDDDTESVLSSGRYFSDEAKVPGVESDVLDEGHVIADSLGGVSNAYNITPQESTLNRHGDQAYMEDGMSTLN